MERAHLAAMVALAIATGGLARTAAAGPEPEAPAPADGGSARDVITMPRLVFAPEIAYPDEARRAGVSGIVDLELEVSATGTVARVSVLASPSALLSRSAEAAARHFRFEPARDRGVPIAVIVSYHYHFELPIEPMAHAAHPDDAATSTAAAPTSGAPTSGAPTSGAPTRPEDTGAPSLAGEAIGPEEGDGLSDARYDVLVRERRPPRSATDFVFELGFARAASPAAGSGSELLRRAPGIYITQHSGEGKAHQIFLRGFDAEHGQDVELRVGGIPVNEPSNVHGQGYADLHFLMPEVARRMRVLEGAYDPRQGDFAVAGSIDFDLGLTERGLVTRLSGGSFGTLRGFVGWGPEDQPEETFVAAELVRSDGFGPSRASSRASAMGQALLSLGSETRLRLLASTYAGRFDSAGVVRLDDLERGRAAFFDTYDPQQGGTSMRHQALAEVMWGQGARSASLSMFLVLRELTLRQNFTGELLFPEGDRAEQRSDSVTLGGASTFARRDLFDALSVEGGISFRHDASTQAQVRLRDLDGRAFYPDVNARLAITDLGVFGDLQLELMRHLALRGGVRAEALAFRIDDRLIGVDARARREGQIEGLGQRREASGFHLGPKTTLDWLAMPWLRAFLSYGNGFRTPPALSLGQGERRPFTTVHSGELGTRLTFGSRLQATLAGFVTHVPDDLTFDHATGQTLFAGATTRSGVAALVTFTALEGLTGNLSATYTHAINHDTGARVPYAPTLVARADLAARAPVGIVLGEEAALFGDVVATVLGPRPLPFDEEGQAVLLLDAGAGVSLGRTSLGLEIANLLDARWRDSELVYASDFSPGGESSRVPARHFTAGRPLTAQATLTLAF